MRKGYEFENELNRVAKYLNAIGVHMHKNHAHRTESGIYLEGEPFDYEVIAHGVIHCFDAKECSAKSWNLSNAKLNQLNNMLVCQKNGAQAYFLVWFRLFNKIIRFDVDFVKQALIEGKKSLTPEEGKLWQWTELHTSKKNTL
ncbi:MAG: Holliday junction resolvase RecU [Synergistaceae bacterium]|nr:Holliday junction resolvase RecU [Synergistaceae bacterium]